MNEHIISYIKDNYINSQMSPQFAVLVKGDWGCGKTFLVKKILMLYHISETLYTFAEVKSMTYEIRNIQYTFQVDIKEQRHKTQ